ncbi:hypothetical protein AMS68_000618 [Peltaster fructicola]|uniref:N-acetyltransferase domain-containing protein n=1 Tax=Peltaster fructicola TaxID=286661 RepID=A0A6H0XKE1_9PEZI|nr:hypothetical protein AMS68_000618 [Peltaster fructicola]
MGIKVEKATPEDAPALTRIGHHAFENDVFQRKAIRFDGANAAQTEEYWTWRIGRMRARLAKSDAHWHKAVDTDTGEIVGFTGIIEPNNAEIDEAFNAQHKDHLPEIVDGPLFAEHAAKMSTTKERLLGDRNDFWYVPAMSVHPRHQRRGVGQALLAANLVLTDAAGSDIYLEAMPAAVKLYQSAGFEVIGALPAILDGLEHPVMLRRYKPT